MTERGPDLERRFHQAMARILELARDEVGSVANRFLQMVSEHGRRDRPPAA